MPRPIVPDEPQKPLVASPYCFCGRNGACFFCYFYPWVQKVVLKSEPKECRTWLAMYSQFLVDKGPYPNSGSFPSGRSIRAMTHLIEEEVSKMFGRWGHYLLQAGAIYDGEKQQPKLEIKQRPSRRLLIQEDLEHVSSSGRVSGASTKT